MITPELYEVTVENANTTVSRRFDNFDDAFECYFKSRYSGWWQSGRLVDGQTGEIYLHFAMVKVNGNYEIQEYQSGMVGLF